MLFMSYGPFTLAIVEQLMDPTLNAFQLVAISFFTHSHRKSMNKCTNYTTGNSRTTSPRSQLPATTGVLYHGEIPSSRTQVTNQLYCLSNKYYNTNVIPFY